MIRSQIIKGLKLRSIAPNLFNLYVKGLCYHFYFDSKDLTILSPLGGVQVFELETLDIEEFEGLTEIKDENHRLIIDKREE